MFGPNKYVKTLPYRGQLCQMTDGIHTVMKDANNVNRFRLDPVIDVVTPNSYPKKAKARPPDLRISRYFCDRLIYLFGVGVELVATPASERKTEDVPKILFRRVSVNYAVFRSAHPQKGPLPSPPDR